MRFALAVSSALVVNGVPAAASDVALGNPSGCGRLWTIADGLPEGIVNAIVETPDHALWLGTHGGLVRFDGSKFDVFDIASKPQLPANRITALTVGPDGRVWCGSEGGVVFCFGAKELVWNFGRPDIFVRSLAFASSSRLFIGTNEGLAVLDLEDGSEIKHVECDWLGGVRAIAADDFGNVWMGTTLAGLVHLADGVCERLPRPDGTEWVNPVVSLSREQDRVYVADATRIGIYAGETAVAIAHSTSTEAPEVLARHVSERNSNQIAVGLSDRMIEVDGVDGWVSGERNIVRVTIAKLQTRTKGISGAIDHTGQIWIGLEGDGMQRVSLGPIQRVHLPPHLMDSGVHAVLSHPDGSLWLSLGTRGLVRVDGAGPELVGFQDELVRSLLADSAGAVLVGSGNQLWRLVDDERHVVISDSDGTGEIHSMLEDRELNIWVGTAGGLWKIQEGRAQRLELPGHDRSSPINRLAQGTDGVIWAASNQALFRATGSQPRSFFVEGGDPIGQIRSILCREPRVVCVGTYGSGVFVLDANDRTRQITTRDGLPENVVISMLADEARDALWLLGNQGAYRMRLSEWDDFLAGRTRFPRYHSFLTQDGMEEGNAGSPAGALLADGSVVFGTIAGPRRILPREDDGPRINDPHVDRVRIDDVDAPLDAGLVIAKPGQHRIDFFFSAENLVIPAATWFECRLAGYEDRWQRLHNDRRISYTDLPPGQYTFELRAALGDGPWVDGPGRVKLRRLAAWHETSTFRMSLWTAGALLLIGFLALLKRRQGARLSAMRAAIQAREAAHDRERRLVDELNHRVRNNLATVLSLIQLSESSTQPRPNGAKGAVPRIHAMARVHTILSKRSWSTVRVTEIIQDVVRSESTKRSSSLEVRGEDPEISPEKCQAIAMVLHELAVNARRHGAWSTPSGSVHIDIAESDFGQLTIDWTESCDRPVVAPDQPGAGLSLVFGFIRHDLKGEIRTSFESPGFRATIQIPTGTV